MSESVTEVFVEQPGYTGSVKNPDKDGEKFSRRQ